MRILEWLRKLFKQNSVPDYYPIHEKFLNDIISECKDKSIQLLDDSLLILSHGGNSRTALGLFIFALEEYGKSLLLKDRISTQKIENWIFGKGKTGNKKNAHQLKIEEALKIIPEGCKRVKISTEFRVYVHTSTLEGSKTVRKGTKVISISEFATGLFIDETNNDYENIDIDVSIRLGCFFIDFPDGKRYQVIDVDKNSLLVAITELRNFIGLSED